MTDEALLSLIHRCSAILSSDPEKALSDLNSYVTTYSDNPIYLQTLGEAYLENSDVESAYTVLSRACDLDPIAEQGVEKFFHLGQIIGGADGIELLEVGVARLLKQAQSLQSLIAEEISIDDIDDGIKILLRAYGTEDKIGEYISSKITQGISAIIEIWMTDLCMLPQAEQECEKLIKTLIDMCDENPETHSIVASVYISQQKLEDAKSEISKSWKLFQEKKQNLEDIANSNNNIDADEIEMIYIEMYELLVTLAKYATECGMFELAADISSSARDINEDGIEALYVEGFANYLAALKIQNPDIEEIDICKDFEKYELVKNDSNSDFINSSRLALSTAVKALHNEELAAQTDEELKTTIGKLLEKVGGFLAKEKDTSGVNEANWENEIQQD